MALLARLSPKHMTLNQISNEIENIINTLNNLSLTLTSLSNITLTGTLIVGPTGSLILTDTTNGHTYQILMVNGKFATQLVT